MKKTRLLHNRFFTQNPFWMNTTLGILALVSCVCAIGIPLILAQESKLISQDLLSFYQVGMIASEDVYAKETMRFIDEIETEKQKTSTLADIPYHFRFSLSTVERVFKRVRALEQEEVFLSLFSKEDLPLVFSIIEEVITELLQVGIIDSKSVVNLQLHQSDPIIVYTIESKGETKEGRILSTVYQTDSLKEIVSDKLDSFRFLLGDTVLLFLTELIVSFLEPNLVYDGLLTELAKKQAVESLEPVYVTITEGDLIIQKDEIVSEEQFRTLIAIRLASMRYSTVQIIGRVLFSIIILGIALYLLNYLFAHNRRNTQFMLIFLMGILCTQIVWFIAVRFAMRRGFVAVDPFLPSLILPMMMALLTNKKRSGMIAATTLASYALLLPYTNAFTPFFMIGTAFCGIYFIRYVSKRMDMLFQWFLCAVFASFFMMLQYWINGFPLSQLFVLLSVTLINVSASFLCVIALLPIIESLGNVPTTFRLRELAFGDSPLLMRLSRVAQGTYGHTMIVAEMAYAAAQRISCDPLLARVGALYHDIGKIENAEYFIENQQSGNKHDVLKESLSVAIIKSHVKIGVEKGREAKLPQEILDIISQHHGNDVIAIFYRNALQKVTNTPKNEKVKIQDYSYHNEIPKTKEAAIVMLADSVEAASRTIQKPSVQKFEKLISQIIVTKIERKQLEDSHLTLTELSQISKSFVQILTSKHHSRIEYPSVEEQ